MLGTEKIVSVLIIWRGQSVNMKCIWPFVCSFSFWQVEYDFISVIQMLPFRCTVSDTVAWPDLKVLQVRSLAWLNSWVCAIDNINNCCDINTWLRVIFCRKKTRWRAFVVQQQMSSVSGRRKNPLNLSLPATVKEKGDLRRDVTKDRDSFSLEDQIKLMTLTEPQKLRMQEWIKEKKLVS